MHLRNPALSGVEGAPFDFERSREVGVLWNAFAEKSLLHVGIAIKILILRMREIKACC